MRTTANLWEVLCRDFNESRGRTPAAGHAAAARQFRADAERILRPKSPRVCDAVEMAGDVCNEAGSPAEARAHFEESLRRNLELQQDAGAGRVAAKLAFLCEQTGDTEAARGFFRTALDAFERACDHSHDCLLLSALASLERHNGNLAAAISLYENAIERATRIHGEHHPTVATLCNNLGVALTESGDFVRSENVHLRALGIRENAFGPMHPEVAQSLGNLAVVYHLAGDYEKARGYYNAALQTYAATHAPDDPELAGLRENFSHLPQ